MSTPLVIKYGGSTMTNPDLRQTLAHAIRQLALKGDQPVIVHGGGPFIHAALAEANLQSTFVRGLRVTGELELPIIERTLTHLGKQLTQEIGGAIGLTGRDAQLLVAKPKDPSLGFVGDISNVNVALLRQLLAMPITPVIACIAAGEAQGVLNVNGDSVTGAVAGALRAPAVFLSDVPGVLDDPQDPHTLLPELSQTDIEARIADGRIASGMIPKVEAALQALSHGADFAVIADGRKPDVLSDVARGHGGTRVIR